MADPLDPTIPDAVSELSLTPGDVATMNGGQAAVPPVDPSLQAQGYSNGLVAPQVPQAAPEAPVAPPAPVAVPAEQVAPGTPVVPVAPPGPATGLASTGMIGPKVGTQTTEDVTKTRSPEGVAALQGVSKAGKESNDATDAAAKAQIQLDKAETAKRIEEADALASVQEARGRAYKDMMENINSDIKTRDGLVADLVNQKPETFWGSKSFGDKLSAAISVGLGSYGGAMLGNGQNVGSMLLERQMNEFQQYQKQNFEARQKQIENSTADIHDKQAMMKDLGMQYDAMQIAAQQRVASKYEDILQNARSPGIMAAAQKAKADKDMEIAKLQLESADKYAVEHHVKMEQDVVRNVAAGNTYDPKLIEQEAAELTKQKAEMDVKLSKLRSTVKILSDPSAPYDSRLSAARDSVSSLNTVTNAQTVTDKDREYYAPELYSSIPMIAKTAGAGAALGTVFPGLGTVAGGSLGALGGVAHEMASPGGFHVTPNLDTYARHAQQSISDIEAMQAHHDAKIQLIKMGIPSAKAEAIIQTRGK